MISHDMIRDFYQWKLKFSVFINTVNEEKKY